MNKKVSVIVLAYNIENYISDCLDSILEQTYNNLEIIIVNDGSDDETGNICDRYALKDDRIQVIHQFNKGVNASRRVGVNKATGEYVGFVDGDDWIEPDMYETLLGYAVDTSSDIVTSSGYREYEQGVSNIERLGDTVKCGIYNIDEDDYYILKKY